MSMSWAIFLLCACASTMHGRSMHSSPQKSTAQCRRRSFVDQGTMHYPEHLRCSIDSRVGQHLDAAELALAFTVVHGACGSQSSRPAISTDYCRKREADFLEGATKPAVQHVNLSSHQLRFAACKLPQCWHFQVQS